METSAVSDREFWATFDNELAHYIDGNWSFIPLPASQGIASPVAKGGSWFSIRGADFEPDSQVNVCVNHHQFTETVAYNGSVNFGIQTYPTNAEGGYIVEMGTSLSCSDATVSASDDVITRTTFFLHDDAQLMPEPEWPSYYYPGPTLDLPQEIPTIQPSIEISNSASITSINPSGSRVTYTINITNTGPGALFLEELRERSFGDITSSTNPSIGDTTCSVAYYLAEQEGYQCLYSAFIGFEEESVISSTVTVSATSLISSVVSASSTVEIGVISDESTIFLPAMYR